jgi:hypothetical protein
LAEVNCESSKGNRQYMFYKVSGFYLQWNNRHMLEI